MITKDNALNLRDPAGGDPNVLSLDVIHLESCPKENKSQGERSSKGISSSSNNLELNEEKEMILNKIISNHPSIQYSKEELMGMINVTCARRDDEDVSSTPGRVADR